MAVRLPSAVRSRCHWRTRLRYRAFMCVKRNRLPFKTGRVCTSRRLAGGLLRQLGEQRRHLLQSRVMLGDVVVGGQLTRVPVAEQGAFDLRPHEDAQRQLEPYPRITLHQRRPRPGVTEYDHLLVSELQTELSRSG